MASPTTRACHRRRRSGAWASDTDLDTDLDLDLDHDPDTDLDLDPTSHLSVLSSPSSPTSSSSSPTSSASPPDPLPFQSLDCYQVARELAALVHRAGIADTELRDQATRAAKSAFLNLCEGLPSDRPGIRRRYFTQADGSLHEVAGAIDLAAAIGALEDAAAAELQRLAVRVRQMLRGLLRSTGRAR